MSIKDRLISFLFGSQPEETPDESFSALNTDTVVKERRESFEAGSINRALLELPAEHPINRLYDLRRKEAGYLPLPRICLDEDGVLPSEMIQKEKRRLQGALKNACNVRLKQARELNRPQKKQSEKELADGPLALDALPWFFLSADKLYAWVLVFPPVGAGMDVSRDMLYQAMMEQGLSYGVDTHAADRLSISRERYFTLTFLAKGKPAFDGKNGNIIDYFPRAVERILEVNEHDQVDYTALNLIRNVKQGQEICRLIRPTEGESGRTVLDEEIPAKSGKATPLPKGRNTEISEDGTLLLAKVDGHVEFTGRSFQVKPVLDITGNVDYSTGNLYFLGDINVHGDVIGGFVVRAMGNIHVSGVVEAGSTVEAGGDLTVVRGILGDGTTTVRAHRSIFSKYIENAVVCAKENLQTDCVIGSMIYCDGEVHVTSGRGRIMGGRVWAGQKICVRAVGSSSECKTTLVLDGSPSAHFERESIQREVHALEVELEKLECQPDSSIRNRLLEKAEKKLAAAELKLSRIEEAEAYEDDMSSDAPDLEEKAESHGRLEYSVAYPGTEIIFGDAVLRLKNTSNHRTAKLVNGEIVLR